MNTELIAKLYDNALIIENREHYTLGALDEVKFAESIVAECVSAIESRAVEGAMSEYYIKQIKKHFGVE
jgi:hypothetical protein